MSLCDLCYAPGICCKGFYLLKNGDERTFWIRGKETVKRYLAKEKLPFVAHLKETLVDDESKRRFGSYEFSCPKLKRNGRCSIYRNRPKVCRNLEPAGGSLLCVHTGGSEGTGDGL